MQKINFQDLPSTTTPLSASNMNAIQTNVENAITEVTNVELLAVSDTAPSECVTGDKYYNTTTKKIYTATSNNTWGSVGEDPISNIFYIVFDENASYSWNGTDLVGIGGSDLTVHDSYDTSTTEPYSANYVNNVIPIMATTQGSSTTNGYAQSYINGIVEEGTTTSGGYIKYKDGTMICYRRKTGNTTVSSGWGSLYESPEIEVGNWPQSFVSRPWVYAFNYSTGNAGFFIENIYVSETDAKTKVGKIILVRPTANANQAYDVSIMGIGRWK